ncbi:MAG: hypothetical protein P4M14_06860 [Gammaproteobacteria bacterium]|nr:hypothetical protein [Gammaproteobacteria bacterium]
MSKLGLAAELKQRFTACNTKAEYAAIRKAIRAYGPLLFENEMEALGVFSEGHIASEEKPFNPFARMIAGKMVNPCTKQLAREADAEEFVLFRNKPENDDHWDDGSAKWLGTASMSKNHMFISPKRNEWSVFNVATLGMGENEPFLGECMNMLKRMRGAALAFAEKNGWKNVFLGFHCYPFCTVNTLHMHVVDLDNLGPTFSHLAYKNLSVDDVLEVLEKEIIEAPLY